MTGFLLTYHRLLNINLLLICLVLAVRTGGVVHKVHEKSSDEEQVNKRTSETQKISDITWQVN